MRGMEDSRLSSLVASEETDGRGTDWISRRFGGDDWI
jgi:hypothetical protein